MPTNNYYQNKQIRYLENRFKDFKFKPITSHKSYITGLKYHTNTEKPIKNKIYLCLLPKVENKFDKHAVEVFSTTSRIGFVPRKLAKKISQLLITKPNEIAVLCYCTGSTTTVSSQCYYNIFKLVKLIDESDDNNNDSDSDDNDNDSDNNDDNNDDNDDDDEPTDLNFKIKFKNINL